MRTLVDLLDENTRVEGEGPFTDLRLKSKRIPLIMDHSNLEVLQKVVSDELEKLALTQHHPFDNLMDTEIQALLNLEKDKSLVIKPSGKGGNLVLMNHCTYKEMSQDILDAEGSFRILEIDPTEVFKSQLETILIKALDDRISSRN